MPKKTVKINTKYYTFNQNNSGGSFEGPAKHLIIEETSAYRAYQKLLEVTGWDESDYCQCCGPRWYETNETGGTESPEKQKDTFGFCKADRIDIYKIVEYQNS